MPQDKLEQTLVKREMAPEQKELLEQITEALRGSRPPFPTFGEPPSVPPPSMFQPDVPVVGGGPAFAKAARMFLDLDPRTKQKVSKVVMGPTRGSINGMIESGMKPDEFADTNLSGVYSYEDRSIGINPKDDPVERAVTLIHELSHAAGANEKRAQLIEKMLGLVK